MAKILKTRKELMEIHEEDFIEFSTRVYVEMAKHIGSKNSISRRKLFTIFFGSPNNMNFYEVDYLWQRLYTVLNYLRKNTECFVVAERGDKETFYYVVKTQQEANKYIKHGNELIESVKLMQKRGQQAVDEQWHKKVIKNASQYRREITYKSTN